MNLTTPKFCSVCKVRLNETNCYPKFTNLLCKPHFNEYTNNIHRKTEWKARRKYEKWHDKTLERRKQFSETAKRMQLKYPYKHSARSQVHYAIKIGTLKREPCKVCGVTKVEGHHKDYEKPLDVVWLCKFHHTKADRNLIKV